MEGPGPSHGRLALAGREADQHLVREQDIAHLPTMRGPLVEVLRRTGLLRRRLLVLVWHYVEVVFRLQELAALQRHRQVPPLSAGASAVLGTVSPLPRRRAGADTRRRPCPRAANRYWHEHLIDPAQLELFPAPERNWKAIRAPGLLKISPEAQEIVGELDQLARAQSWTDATRKKSLRTLRVLLGRLGTRTPLLERDVYGVGSMTPHYNTVRVAGFLQTKGLLAPDPETMGVDEASVDRWTAQAPPQFQADLHAWVAVLRGNGKRPSPAMPWNTIRGYMLHVVAVLDTWDHLRAEVALQGPTTRAPSFP